MKACRAAAAHAKTCFRQRCNQERYDHSRTSCRSGADQRHGKDKAPGWCIGVAVMQKDAGVAKCRASHSSHFGVRVSGCYPG